MQRLQRTKQTFSQTASERRLQLELAFRAFRPGGAPNHPANPNHQLRANQWHGIPPLRFHRTTLPQLGKTSCLPDTALEENRLSNDLCDALVSRGLGLAALECTCHWRFTFGIFHVDALLSKTTLCLHISLRQRVLVKDYKPPFQSGQYNRPKLLQVCGDNLSPMSAPK